MMIVATDGSGDFTTVQAAINAIPADNAKPVTIHIKNGVYKEKVRLEKPYVTLIGEDKDKTIITYDDHANKLFPNGELYGTFNSYTILFGAHHITAKNLSFVNSAGTVKRVGQALAAYVDGDRVSFYNCRFLGHQDTLFTGPLPDKPMKGSSFGGPRDMAEKTQLRQYYEDCYIEGDVDFIFGSAAAVFNRCEIFSLAREMEQSQGESAQHNKVHGWITAASTVEHAAFGYVFIECRLTSNAPAQTFYLGRPWRNEAKTAFISCWMGEHIIDAGWHNWNKPEAEQTVQYGEYNSSGPGAANEKRCSWSKVMNVEEAARFTISNILSGEDGWNPEVNNNV